MSEESQPVPARTIGMRPTLVFGIVLGTLAAAVGASRALDAVAAHRIEAAARDQGVTLTARSATLTLVELPLESALFRRFVVFEDAALRVKGSTALIRARRVNVGLEAEEPNVTVVDATVEVDDMADLRALARNEKGTAHVTFLNGSVVVVRGRADHEPLPLGSTLDR